MQGVLEGCKKFRAVVDPPDIFALYLQNHLTKRPMKSLNGIFYPAQQGFDGSVEEVLFLEGSKVLHLNRDGSVAHGPTHYEAVGAEGEAVDG